MVEALAPTSPYDPWRPTVGSPDGRRNKNSQTMHRVATSLPPSVRPLSLPLHTPARPRYTRLMPPATAPLRHFPKGATIGPRGGMRVQPSLKFWYDNLIDFIIAKPNATNDDCAAYTGRSPNYISIVRHSDSFKARYEQRRAAMNRDLTEHVQQRLSEATGKTLDLLLEKLEKGGAALKLSDVLDASDRLLGRLGYGAKAGPAVNIDTGGGGVAIIEGSITAHELRLAQERLRQLEHSNATSSPVDATPVAAPPAKALSAKPESFTIDRLAQDLEAS